LDAPAFQRELHIAKAEIHKNGSLFKERAKAQALAMLDIQWSMLNDPITPATVKDNIMERTIRLAGHDPKSNPVSAQGPQTQAVFVKINFSGSGVTK
jgi:hypothetical protein